MESVRNRLSHDLLKKDEIKNIIKRKSKLMFNAIHKSYENCYSYTFEQNAFLLNKPIYVGFFVLELSKLRTYEITYYDKSQPYFGQESRQCLYIDTDAFALSLNTINIIRHSKIIENLFDFSDSNENHELLTNKNRKSYWKI